MHKLTELMMDGDKFEKMANRALRNCVTQASKHAAFAIMNAADKYQEALLNVIDEEIKLEPEGMQFVAGTVYRTAVGLLESEISWGRERQIVTAVNGMGLLGIAFPHQFFGDEGFNVFMQTGIEMLAGNKSAEAEKSLLRFQGYNHLYTVDPHVLMEIDAWITDRRGKLSTEPTRPVETLDALLQSYKK